MTMNINNVLQWLDEFGQLITQHKDYLSELDTPIGDGDHGNNMYRGVTAVAEQLAKAKPDNISDIFKTVAMALMSNVGGASGPLYGSAFLEMSKQAKLSDSLPEIISAGLIGIQKRGKAQIGEKTMVDVWARVSAALTAGSLTEDTIQQAVLATKDMQATKGRASYLGERSVGNIDPGATSSGYLFTAMLHHM